jgi:hypothetical protein
MSATEEGCKEIGVAQPLELSTMGGVPGARDPQRRFRKEEGKSWNSLLSS